MSNTAVVAFILFFLASLSVHAFRQWLWSDVFAAQTRARQDQVVGSVARWQCFYCGELWAPPEVCQHATGCYFHEDVEHLVQGIMAPIPRLRLGKKYQRALLGFSKVLSSLLTNGFIWNSEAIPGLSSKCAHNARTLTRCVLPHFPLGSSCWLGVEAPVITECVES